MHLPRLRSRLVITLTCLVLIGLIGYGDYSQGSESSMLLLYLIPIALATWYGGISLGVAIAAVSVAVDLFSDQAAGVPNAGVWNTVTGFLYYVVFLVLLSRCHDLLSDMHRRVEERTADLRREIGARKALEHKIAEVAEHERRRLGRELHDGLCQHLTGTALKAQTVVSQLQGGDNSALDNACKVVSLVDRGIDIAREIARGLFSSELEGEGLSCALGVLAKATSHEHKIDCRFQPNGEVTMSSDKATQLYWIAREAVRNAVTHAQATRIEIGLTRANGHVELTVEDDGTGIPRSEGVRNGIGLLVMTQRAELAGGLLRTERSDSGGTAVRCIISPDT